MKQIIPLTAAKIDKAKRKTSNYSLYDGAGLHLYVTTQGSKLWRMKVRIHGKYTLLSFGKYPAITLADARKKRDEVHSLVAHGHDPREVWKAEEMA